MSSLADMLVRHEGLKLKPYMDTKGKLTIGVGRNLYDVGISKDEAMVLLDHDIATATAALSPYPWFNYLDPVRKDVLISMVFNMGIAKVLEFHKVIADLQTQNFSAASAEMLNSAWAVQVGQRAQELSEMMREGRYL